MSLCVGALVQVEQVAERLVVQRESTGAVRGGVHVGVSGDEDVGPAVAVDVRDGRARVPAVRAEGIDAGGVRAVGERPVAVVPEEHVVGVRRDEKVGVAVTVEVGRDATVPLDGRVRVRSAADVGEAASADVFEESATRQAALRCPSAGVRVGVRVDDEEVESAVVVVVQPAEATPHHRVDVIAWSRSGSRLA